MKQYLLATFFSLTSLVALGQRGPQDFVVTTAGDTLRGSLIIKNKSTVKLRQPGVGRRVFGPTEVRSYGDQSGIMGLTRTVGAHGQPQFVVPLVQGPVSLYSGANARGEKTYFLQVPDSTYLIGIPRQTAQLTFHKLLFGCPELEFGTNQAQGRYPVNYLGLTRLVMTYNACTKPQEPSRVVKSAVGLRFLYGVKAGLNTGSFALSYEAYPGQVQNATGYQAGVFLQVSNKTRFSAVLEATYQALRGTYAPVAPSTRTVTIEYSQLQIPLLLRYTVGSQAVRPYLNAGFLYAVNLRNQSATTEPTPGAPSPYTVAITSPEQVGFGFTAGLGTVIRRGGLPELGLEVRYDRMRYGNYVFYTPQHSALRLDFSIGF